MAITEFEQKFLFKIKEACDDYLNKKISIEYFQKLLEAYFRNWENNISKKNYNSMKNF